MKAEKRSPLLHAQLYSPNLTKGKRLQKVRRPDFEAVSLWFQGLRSPRAHMMDASFHLHPNTQGPAVGKVRACSALHLKVDGLSELLHGPERRTQRLWVLSGPLHHITISAADASTPFAAKASRSSEIKITNNNTSVLKRCTDLSKNHIIEPPLLSL